MKMKGAKILTMSLIHEGVDTVFCYPGGTVIDIFDELYHVRDQIRQILPAHEQGGGHAADAYARVTGKVGVMIATSGPGATNTVTAVANAYMDSVPMVVITGNVTLSSLGRDSFQEIDIAGVTMPITKHNYIVKDIADLSAVISEAFYLARSGRPGPVLVDIPKDIQQTQYEWTPPARREISHTPPSVSELESAAAIINSAKKPLLYVGGGVIISNADKELKEFAEKIDCPVSCSMMGLGAFPASHSLYMGMIGMHGHAGVSFALQSCDVIIALGARFADRVAGDRKNFAKGAKIVHIDIDTAEIDKNVATKAHVVGDIKTVLNALTPMLDAVKRPEWTAHTAELTATKQVKESAQKLNPRAILRAISKQGGPELVVATDVGQHQMWAAQSCTFEKPRTFVTSGGLGTMGFGMGAAIGAAVGIGGGKPVALITGDGSFHMNMNEVVTAVTQCLPIAIFVFNNNTLGMVRQWQKLFYGKRYSCTTLNRPTNYEYLAKALGAEYLHLDDNADLDKTVNKALTMGCPVIVNCIIQTDENVFPMIPAGKSASEIIMEISEES